MLAEGMDLIPLAILLQVLLNCPLPRRTESGLHAKAVLFSTDLLLSRYRKRKPPLDALDASREARQHALTLSLYLSEFFELCKFSLEVLYLGADFGSAVSASVFLGHRGMCSNQELEVP
jgi:hypothetical protein